MTNDYYSHVPEINDTDEEYLRIRIQEMKRILRAKFDQDAAEDIITKHLDRHIRSSDELYNTVMDMVPDITSQKGLTEGLKISQDLKNAYKKAPAKR